MQRILLIDDDERLAELLKSFFQRYEIQLDYAGLPSLGMQKLAFSESGQSTYDLVILDIMLPEIDGFEVCKAIRKKSDIPVIMLTARGEVMDRIVGLEIGADDYLPKPFEPRELLARVNTILKRVKSKSADNSPILQFGPLLIDRDLRQVKLEQSELNLSSGEYALLELLASSPSKIFHRDEIMNHLRGTDTEIYSRAIDILVSRLRQKLKPHSVIKTVRGRGYCFVAKVDHVSR